MCYETLVFIFLNIIIIITIIIITFFLQVNRTQLVYFTLVMVVLKEKQNFFVNNMSSWDKVLSAKEKRLKTLMTSQYGIILPTFPDVFYSHYGYHTLCYKSFTAFSTSLGHLKEVFQPEKRSTTTSKVSAIPTTLTGCLRALCIFCGKIESERKMGKFGKQ